MPFEYVVELVCDWLAAATTYDEVSPGDVFVREYYWWKTKSQTAKIHQGTKVMIDKILWNFKEYYTNYTKDCGMDGKCAEKKTLERIKSFIKGWKHEYEHGETEIY